MKIKEQAAGVGFAASMDEINKTLDFWNHPLKLKKI